MMEEGYYVPDISEFHKGFQYEIKYYDSENFEKKEFQGYFGRAIDILEGDNLQTEEVRVKYLDKTDIESLGWVKGDNGKFYIGDIVLDFNYDKHYLHIHTEEYNWDTCIFSGIVRNKSELKKLMSQLEILDETLI